MTNGELFSSGLKQDQLKLKLSITIKEEIMNFKKLKRAPTSPGEILKEEFLVPMNLTQKELSVHINVDIKVINRLVNNKTSVSLELALKLASAFNTSPEFWLNAQLAVDLYNAYNEIGQKLPGLIHNKAG